MVWIERYQGGCIVYNYYLIPQPNIRESAAETLDACLRLVQIRDKNSKKQWQRKVYEEAVRGLSQVSVDIIHGSLLAFRCLLNHSMKFMEDSKYRETFELIFRLREHKEPMIRKVVILAIAGLASYDSDLFARDYLSPSMEFILISLRKEKEKSTCKFPSASFSSYWSVFNAIGEIVQSVKSGITDYLPSILALIKESLSPVRRSVRSIHFFLF